VGSDSSTFREEEREREREREIRDVLSCMIGIERGRDVMRTGRMDVHHNERGMQVITAL
jgi:hypothetical protein